MKSAIYESVNTYIHYMLWGEASNNTALREVRCIAAHFRFQTRQYSLQFDACINFAVGPYRDPFEFLHFVRLATIGTDCCGCWFVEVECCIRFVDQKFLVFPYRQPPEVVQEAKYQPK